MKDYLVTHIDDQGNRFLAACLFDNMQLEELLVERAGRASLVGGIYIGSLESRSKDTGGAFVRLNKDTHCFLKNYDSKKSDGGRVLVQVTKDAAGNKQAAATQELRLAGRYTVISHRETGLSVSAKLPSAEKNRLRDLFSNDLVFPEGHVLLRTEAAFSEPVLVREEAGMLRAKFLDILKKAGTAPVGTCLFEPEPFYLRFYESLSFPPERILTDLPFAEEPLRQLAKRRNVPFAEKRPGSLPYAEIYGLKTALEKLLGRCIHLKCGAELVIQPTEAFVSVDVNSAHFKGSGTPERNARRINEEAICEIFRQMRLRRLSGVLLVDLINMKAANDRCEVLAMAKELAGKEHIKTEAVDITPLGILEIVREKSGPSLFESIHP